MDPTYLGPLRSAGAIKGALQKLDSIAAKLEELEKLPERIDHVRAHLDDLEERATTLAGELGELGKQLEKRPPAEKRAQRPNTERDPVIAALRRAHSERAAALRDAEPERKKLAALQQEASTAETTAAALRDDAEAVTTRLKEVQKEIAALKRQALRGKLGDVRRPQSRRDRRGAPRVSELITPFVQRWPTLRHPEAED